MVRNVLTLVAIDSSGDVCPLRINLGEKPDKTNMMTFSLFIKEVLKYPAKSITTDLDIMSYKISSKSIW